MNEDLVAIVIPIYQKVLSPFEDISLKQCLKVLGNYPVYFVKGNSLDADYLKNYTQTPSFELFEDSFFESTTSYNRLMIDLDFYARFKKYKFILIYQLDAFVFQDNLKYWCEKDYDYIGAPKLKLNNWLDFKNNKISSKPITLATPLLNGGLSLRKVKPITQFLKIFHFFFSKLITNEDTLFSVYHRREFLMRPFIKLPQWFEALPFAFEQNPTICFEVNNNELPFGCHAWERYDKAFWREMFKENGYEI